MAEQMSYVQFAARHGLVTDYDVQSHIHAGLRAAHMPNSYHRWYKARLVELQNAREEGLRRYSDAITSGEIEPFPEPTRVEALEAKASGDPDLPSVRAAKRVLERVRARQVSSGRSAA